MSIHTFNFNTFLKNINYSSLSSEQKINQKDLLYNKRYNLYYSLEDKYSYDLTNYDLINKYIEYIKVLLYLDEKDSIEINIGNNLVRVDNNLNGVEKFLGLSVKRKRYEQLEVDNEWLSPNIIKAGLIGDNYTVIKKLKAKRNINQILLDGIEFERKIISIIQEKNPNHFFQIGESSNISDINKFNLTIDKMALGVPIIYQPVLYDFDRKVYCCPDIIIRNDFINSITNLKVKDGSCYFSDNWYYLVIDIKNKKLKLNVDLTTIRNDTIMMKMNKGQIYICNEILGKIQEYTPSKGYILGNGWRVDSKHLNKIVNDPFDKLGVIDFEYRDANIKETIEEVYDIIEKYKNVDMDQLPPELYPNMKNKYDFYDQKMEVALKVGELTMLPYVTYEHRLIGHSNGIYSWKDANCSANKLGITEGRGKLINRFISANRDNIKYINRIKDFNNDKLNLFVDFETIEDTIFMIGLVYQLNGMIYEKQFVMKDLNNEERQRVINDFGDMLDELGNHRIYHWGYFEKGMIKGIDRLNKYEWIDMKEIIKKDMIVLPTMFGYGLKNVANTMYNLGMIKTIWDNKFKDGLQAMNEAKKYYVNKNSDILESIKYYNLVDCKVMKEIYDYFGSI